MEQPPRKHTYSSEETGGPPADDEPRPVDHDPPEDDMPRFDEAQRTGPAERAGESTESPAEQSPKP